MFDFSDVCDASHYINVDSLDIFLITGAALVDSINPCAIAVLLILLTGLLSVGDKRKAVISGLAFVSALYLAYLTIGLGLWGVIQLAGLAGILHQVIGGIAIIIGLVNIKDYFWYGGLGFVTEIPRAWRPKMKKLLRGVASPIGAFIAGLIVTLFELPCTGGPYLFVLGLLSQGYSWFQVVTVLLYYNLVFILPLLIIIGFMYWGYTSIDKVTRWKNQNFKRLHLIAGLIMLILGLWVVLS